MPVRKPLSTRLRRMAASALPRNRRMRQDAGAFAVGLEAADDVQQVGVIALAGRRHAPAKALERVRVRVRPEIQALAENGGLATT